MNFKNGKIRIVVSIIVIILACVYFFKKNNNGEVVVIGYQSITAQTWGAILIKDMHLVEKNYTGNKKVTLEWQNFMSGPPITSNMLARKIQIGFMGDMPLLTNGDLSQHSNNYKSELGCFDGKSFDGRNQSIVVNNSSYIFKVADLKGKKISVVNSSSAHKFLLQELELAGVNQSDVQIQFQDIPTAIILLDKKEVDAVVAWEPYPQMLIDAGTYRRLEKLSEDRYLAGVVVDSEWKNNNKDVFDAFSKAIKQSHMLLEEKSPEVVRIISNETGFEESVVREVIGNIKWEDSIMSQDVLALNKDAQFLIKMQKLSDNFNLNDFIGQK